MEIWEAAWTPKFVEVIARSITAVDPAHDLQHFKRVVATARRLHEATPGSSWEVICPAAWLHDLVNVPKNDSRRAHASRLSADAAVSALKELGYPFTRWDEIHHAVAAHSFSAGIVPETIEAKIVQDADRLDGLGAIGVARLFCVTGLLRRSLYHAEDPFGRARPLDDLEFAVDHFYKKLFPVSQSLQTEEGRREGARRAAFMTEYLNQLGAEL